MCAVVLSCYFFGVLDWQIIYRCLRPAQVVYKFVTRNGIYPGGEQLFRKFERESVTEGRFDGVARASRVEREKGLFSGDEFPSGCVPGGGAKMRRSNDCGFGGGR